MLYRALSLGSTEPHTQVMVDINDEEQCHQVKKDEAYKMRPSSQRGKVERKNRMEEKTALIGHLKIIALNVAHIATVLWEHS